MPETSEEFIAALVGDFSQQNGDSDQWVIYRRYDRDLAEAVIAAAHKAALRADVSVFIAEVPEYWADAPVRRLPGTVVLRFADHPEPWTTTC